MEYQIRELIYTKKMEKYGHICPPKNTYVDKVPAGEKCTIDELANMEMEIETCTAVSQFGYINSNSECIRIN